MVSEPGSSSSQVVVTFGFRDRPRPKGKHSVCLLFRISGLKAEEFGDADERAIKESAYNFPETLVCINHWL